ncbi:diacylglycerol kinase [Komagataeibacter sucrofermentans]|uniref:Diacylglycerol kinase n=2 Tax=Komagataeibacter sucrofermentans TaxID=1053551 RepID=A0A318QSN1_9PROT|nr:diacylglycerol kinase [Komagataeibacter sucrofermentans]GBQ47636.1 sphingosine kinase [Komagataeibacter sucrofermentans DSM 15973]
MAMNASRSVTIIVNPTAGRRRSGHATRLARILRRAGVAVQVVHTRDRGHATELARAAVEQGGCSHVVATGGDGTVAEVARGLEGSDVVLAVLPVGTANVLARELDLPFDEGALARSIIAGTSTTVWPGVLHTAQGASLFVQMAGVGFDAYVVHTVSPRLKKAVGRAAYVVSVLRALWGYRYPVLRVEVEGVVHEASSAIISKGALYAGRHVLAPASMQEEKAFSVVLFGSAGPWATLRYGLALLRGTLPRQKDVTVLRASTVAIPAPTGLPVQSDGDAHGYTAIRADINDQPIRIAICPRAG